MGNLNVVRSIIQALRDVFNPRFNSEKDIVVDLEQENSWREKEWTKRENSYEGTYRVKMSKYRGEIVDRAGEFDVFIFNPPYVFRQSHCVHDRGGGKFWIHLQKHPADVDSAILNVERMIAGSLKV